jgi:anti-sigma B factor antagonist
MTLRDQLRPPGPVSFSLSERRRGATTTLMVSGELDVLTAPRFAGHVSDILRQRRGDVIVDLTRVTFIDSTGLHVLLNARRRLARQERSLTVRCRAGPVRQTIELLRLAETLGLG